MIHVVGGTYREMCREPRWDELFGSGLRAAAALTSLSDEVHLRTYVAEQHRPTLEAYAIEYGLETEAVEIPDTLGFSYAHGLSRPSIDPPLHLITTAEPLEIEAPVVLRFGILEGDAVVRARRAVYDPQSAYNPKLFAENGSAAEHLAMVVNSFEARALTGEHNPDLMGPALLEQASAEVVVLKRGAAGALVFHENGSDQVPAFRADKVFPTGSGDVFSAVFAHHWAEKDSSPSEAAQQASRATAWYCATRRLRLPSTVEIHRSIHDPIQPTTAGRQPRRIYLAGPFFTTAQRWLIDEARDGLHQQGVAVFSPFHDVGVGPAKEVVPKDVAELDSCDAVFAIVDGFDAGTLFEVGYARARGTPVVAFVQNAPEEPLKMLVGTDCQIVDDFVTAVYCATWAALEH